MPEPTLKQSLDALHMGPDNIERLRQVFYAAKLDVYRSTMSDLRSSFGGPARVYLGDEIRDALGEEAVRDAESVAQTFNGFIDAEAGRSSLKGQALFDHLAAYGRERGQRRAAMIGHAEIAPARLDATVAFFRENGVEPQFDLVGPAPKCPICTALKATNPHAIELVVRVGQPHIGCTHTWKARAYSAAKLKAGGVRPGKISAGAGGPAGIINSPDLRSSLAGLSEDTIASAIRNGELVAVTS